MVSSPRLVRSDSSPQLNEPTAPKYLARRTQRRQVARIICHLRDQMAPQHPQLSMPSNWMVSCLVHNIWHESASQLDSPNHDWPAMVAEVLRSIRSCTNVGLEHPCEFRTLDDESPLFPNRELFDEWDAYRFSQAALHHLDKELA